MAQLSTEQAKLADEAIARVRAAAAAGRAALDSESRILIRLTGATSAREARESSLRATEKILEQLEAARPALTSDGTGAKGLVGFLELAKAGAQVDELVAEARRMTAAGFNREVVQPTLRDANPLNPSGAVGRTILFALAAVVAVGFLTRSK